MCAEHMSWLKNDNKLEKKESELVENFLTKLREIQKDGKKTLCIKMVDTKTKDFMRYMEDIVKFVTKELSEA